MKFEVSVSGWEDEGIEESIVSQVVSRIAESLDDKVSEAVAAMVDEAARKIIAERITKEVDDIIEMGWDEKGDSYYGRGNRHYTLREKIEAVLTTKDNYGRDRTLPGIVTSELRAKFDAEVKDGTKRLREKIDQVINSTIEETITGDIRAKIRKAIAC